MSKSTIEEQETGLPCRRQVSRRRIVTTCYFRADQLAGLRQLSEAEDVPMAALIRKSVDRLLREAGI